MTTTLRPTAFRIRDYRSIKESRECPLSRDGITVLAGQNEAGKTAILLALRDFDLDPGEASPVDSVIPEDDDDAQPEVGVEFEYSFEELWKHIDEPNRVPETIRSYLAANTRIWVYRNILAGSYRFGPELSALWAETSQAQGEPEDTESDSSAHTEQETAAASDAAQDTQLYGETEFAGEFRSLWPVFVYFDSFNDILPSSVDLHSLVPSLTGVAADAAKRVRIPPAVKDFIAVSGLDLKRLEKVAKSDKALLNYLEDISSNVTGDFCGYYRQKSDGAETVHLTLESTIAGENGPRLSFFVKDDGKRKRPEQRSKGFQWFLSFYLRLAAYDHTEERDARLVLIDEPGTNLHIAAQRDVLRLLEAKQGKGQAFIYTTHSPALLPAEKLHRVRIVIRKPKSGTLVIDRITSPELQGDEHKDAISPVVESLGMDIRDAMGWIKSKNVITEGVSDMYYLNAWAAKVDPSFLREVSIFPGRGARSTAILASLFTGWGLDFAVLLDRDEEGNSVRAELISSGLVNDTAICQIQDGVSIEDVFSRDDFEMLLKQAGMSLSTSHGNERPTQTIRQSAINKIALARSFAELSASGSLDLSEKTTLKAKKLVRDLRAKIQSPPSRA